MGVSFKELITKKEDIEIKDLANKILAIDTFNLLYQFITTIRQQDGTPLKDSKGNVTSHLIGLFSRTTHLMRYNIKPIFVFDGVAPDLKEKERERRNKIKEDAQEMYEKAVKEEDVDSMKKYAQRTSRLTPEMVDDAKLLITALGLPYIDAPSEGDAQAAYLVKKGDAWATVSQDFDTLMHGSPRFIKNLSIAGRRKRSRALAYDTIKPELIKLSDVLNELHVDLDHLIYIGMLIGTDYNIGGIRGIGPKNAIKLINEFKDKPDELFTHVNWNDLFDNSWKTVFDTIKKMAVTDDYTIEFKDVNEKEVKSVLCDRFDFSEERVDSTLSKLMKDKKTKEQKGLGDFY